MSRAAVYVSSLRHFLKMSPTIENYDDNKNDMKHNDMEYYICGILYLLTVTHDIVTMTWYGCVFSFAWQVADEVYSWNYELGEDEGGEGWKAVRYLHLYGISTSISNKGSRVSPPLSATPPPLSATKALGSLHLYICTSISTDHHTLDYALHSMGQSLRVQLESNLYH